MSLNLTKKQIQILEILFNNPEKSFYLRQLAKLLGVEPGVFQRDINKLTDGGLLVSEFQANSRFFRLNKEYPLFEEIKSILAKTVGAEAKLRELFSWYEDIKIAFIFGSYAKGETDSLSDIDIMIVGNVNEKEFVTKLVKIEEKLSREVNYHIYAPEDLKKKVQNKDSFLRDVIKKPKVFLIGDEKSLRKIY